MGGRSVLLVALVATAACKSGKPLPIIGGEIPARSAERILERALTHERDTIRYYSARASVSVKLSDSGRSFKAHIRSVEDSAAWISVVPALGIEVARILLTADSLFIMDKLADQYFVGDTAAAATKFGVRPSLALLQQALLGKAIGLDPEEKYRSDREDGQYLLTSREKRRFIRAAEEVTPVDTLVREPGMPERRLERTLRKAEEKEAIVMRYWFEPEDFRVTRVQIADLVRDQTADVRYEERGGPEEGLLPSRIRITLSEPGRQASGTFELSRISATGPLQMNFRIPEKFTPMP
ncbi:MAG: DUF4292 domain-containing protein [Flavobacteriales bacterium]|nr:DUF4292 domain-containing protein [Flavobacteriales bacterium]